MWGAIAGALTIIGLLVKRMVDNETRERRLIDNIQDKKKEFDQLLDKEDKTDLSLAARDLRDNLDVLLRKAREDLTRK